MDDYRKQIDSLISKVDGEVLLNGSTSHAAMVIERMLSRAQGTVRIMTRFLDPLIYCEDATKRAAVDFLRAGKKLKILVDDLDGSESHPYFCELQGKNELEIRRVPESLRESIAINFSIMDNKGFRLEKDASGETAVVAFGLDNINARLVSLFDSVWKESIEVKIAA